MDLKGTTAVAVVTAMAWAVGASAVSAAPVYVDCDPQNTSQYYTNTSYVWRLEDRHFAYFDPDTLLWSENLCVSTAEYQRSCLVASDRFEWRSKKGDSSTVAVFSRVNGNLSYSVTPGRAEVASCRVTTAPAQPTPKF